MEYVSYKIDEQIRDKIMIHYASYSVDNFGEYIITKYPKLVNNIYKITIILHNKKDAKRMLCILLFICL